MKQLKNVFAILTLLFTALFIACSDGNGGDDKDSGTSGDSIVCTYYMKDDTSVYYVFYGDGSVEYYSKGELQYKRGVLRYKGNPKSKGTVDITVNTGTLLVTFKVSYVNKVLVPTVELVPGFPVEYTLTLDGENNNGENSGTDKENTEGSGENGNGENDNTENVNTCKWVLDADHSIYFIFYPDNTVEYYSYDSLEYDRSTLNYEGSPTEAGTVTIKVNTGVPLFTFTVTKNGSSVTAKENNMGLTYTMAGNSSNNGESGNDENGGTETPEEPSTDIDESPLMFMGFDNVVTIEKGTDITGITNTIYSLTSDTTLKFKGGINSITLTTIAAAMGTNDSVKIALDFSEATGITEWTNKLAGQKTLYAISLPGTVTSVQKDAFTNCTNLKAITVPCSITAYPSTPSSTIVNFVGTLEDWLNASMKISGAQPLYLNGEEVRGEVTVPDGISTIRSGAFSNCPNLTKIVLPESVTSIESYAFANCGVATASNWDGYSYVSLSFTCGAQSLESINLENVTNIGDYAFAKCNSLRELNLTGWRASIGNYAFFNCNALESINLENIISIGEYAFYGCAGLMTATINGDYGMAASIGNYAFYHCDALKSINLEEIDSLGDCAFAECSLLTNVVIDIESIGNSAFYNCSGLESIELKSADFHIGNKAFYGCIGLTSVSLPLAVDGIGYGEIGDYAFYGCSSLTSIRIPDTTHKIGESAFSNCTNLRNVIFEEESEERITASQGRFSLSCSKNLFTKCPLETVYIGRILSTDTTKASYSPFYNQERLLSVEISYWSGINEYMFYGCSSLTSVTIPAQTIDNVIARIGEYAFYNCSRLTSVTIPNNVEAIEQYAFYGCSNLSSITIPNSVHYIYNYAFNGCSSLKELIIEDGDSDFYGFGYHTYSSNAIGKGLFYDCPLETVYIGRNCYESNSNTGYSPFYCNDTLSTLQIGKSVTQIGPYMFYGCTSLTNVSIPTSVTRILDYAFANCTGLTNITIPNSVTEIGQSAFANCTGLTNITIPNSVTEIGQSAFENCARLTSISIPDSITRIESNIFYGCSGLTNITIPNSVTEIGQSAFENCAGLTSILIPDSVSKIGASSFKNCAWLEDIILSDGVESIGQNAFQDCIRIKSITIPSSVTSIASNAFRGAYQITELIIADSETPLSLGCTVYDNNVGSQRYGLFFDCTLQTVYIGRNLDATYPAFYNETSLFSVEISNNVTMITSSTFSGCRSLTSVIIPSTVTYIMDYVFKDCTDLTTINYRGSEEQWNAINIGSDNTPLTTATIIYNYTGD